MTRPDYVAMSGRREHPPPERRDGPTVPGGGEGRPGAIDEMLTKMRVRQTRQLFLIELGSKVNSRAYTHRQVAGASGVFRRA